MSKSPQRIRRALIGVLCAFVLLAQQAALTHVVWHAASGQSAQYDNDGAYERQRAPASDLAALCALDAAFGQILAGGPAISPSLFVCVRDSQRTADHSRGIAAADVLTPRSRGPPVLL
jgi:hypothetical protein